jgi:hypothetical protein
VVVASGVVVITFFMSKVLQLIECVMTMTCFSIALVLGLICGLFFFAAPRISASRQPSDSTAPLISRAGTRSLFSHMQCFVKRVYRVTKPMCHPFRTNMFHMCHACEM